MNTDTQVTRKSPNSGALPFPDPHPWYPAFPAVPGALPLPAAHCVSACSPWDPGAGSGSIFRVTPPPLRSNPACHAFLLGRRPLLSSWPEVPQAGPSVLAALGT